MTAGKGISHSEESPEERSDTVQLAQFWIALPEKKRFIEPAFEHHAELPRFERQGADITLLVGELLNHTSPVKVYSRSEEHTSELQSRFDLVCRLLLEKTK